MPNDVRQISGWVVRGELLALSAWAGSAAFAHDSLALAALALAPATLSFASERWLRAQRLNILGPLPPPSLQRGEPNQQLQFLWELRRRQQVHYDRAWLLLTVILLLVAIDLRFDVRPIAAYHIIPAALIVIVLRRIIAAAHLSQLTDDVAEIVVVGLPSRSPPQPLRLASLSAIAAMGLSCLAFLAGMVPDTATALQGEQLTRCAWGKPAGTHFVTSDWRNPSPSGSRAFATRATRASQRASRGKPPMTTACIR